MFDTYSEITGQSTRPARRLDMRVRGNSKIPINECTEFTMHISQRTEYAGSKYKFIDYTEHKLRRYIDGVNDKQQAMVLKAMLVDYLTGNIAVAWRKGQPVYIKVTKG